MRRFVLGIVCTVLTLTGCNNSLPPETNPSAGREALKTVLDTWVKGGTIEDLKNGNPAIVAHDPDWVAGHKLTKYEIGPNDRRSGVDLVLNVTLSLNRKDGKAQDKKVNYAVAIGSQTVVLRYE